jgi:hypothetical protein
MTVALVSKFKNGNIKEIKKTENERDLICRSKDLTLSSRIRNSQLVKFTMNGQSLYIFNNHWPSRRARSDKKYKINEKIRIKLANLIKDEIERIKRNGRSNYAGTIILGDFNSHYNQAYIDQKIFGDGFRAAMNHSFDDRSFYNLWNEIEEKQNRYSSFYQNKKNTLDSIIITNNLLRPDNENLKYKDNSYAVIGHKGTLAYFILNNPDSTPFRWQSNSNKNKFYNHIGEGFSDHLPITAQFILNDKQDGSPQLNNSVNTTLSLAGVQKCTISANANIRYLNFGDCFIISSERASSGYPSIKVGSNRKSLYLQLNEKKSIRLKIAYMKESIHFFHELFARAYSKSLSVRMARGRIGYSYGEKSLFILSKDDLVLEEETLFNNNETSSEKPILRNHKLKIFVSNVKSNGSGLYALKYKSASGSRNKTLYVSREDLKKIFDGKLLGSLFYKLDFRKECSGNNQAVFELNLVFKKLIRDRGKLKPISFIQRTSNLERVEKVEEKCISINTYM